MADGDSKQAEEKELLKDASNPAFEPSSPDSVEIGMQLIKFTNSNSFYSWTRQKVHIALSQQIVMLLCLWLDTFLLIIIAVLKLILHYGVIFFLDNLHCDWLSAVKPFCFWIISMLLLVIHSLVNNFSIKVWIAISSLKLICDKPPYICRWIK